METIFFINNCDGARLLFNSIRFGLFEYQQTFQSSTLSGTIKHLTAHLTEVNKIIVSEDWYNDFTDKKANSFDDFIYAREKLNLFIPRNKCIVKWCFLIDAPYCRGDIRKLLDYCSENEVEFINVNHSNINEFIKFVKD